jgi:hypothetical protein
MQLDSRFVKIAHDPGDPVLCSHCPFCGSGQITGRSDGGIDCAFCGQSFIVRVQPAFPGMPQAPGMGAPTDVGPDMMGMPPGMEEGGMPPGMEEEGMPPGAEGEEDGGAPPFGEEAGEEEEGAPPGEEEEGEEEGEGEAPPPFKKKSSRTFRTIAGDQLPEDAYVRHLAILLSGRHPAVLARVRRDAARDPEYAGHYNRGWKASQGGGANSALDRADFRHEPDAWYDGYHDYAADRPKFHSRDCSGSDHDAPGCTLWDDEAAS